MVENRTLIVPVDDYSFNKAMEENIYACPASYGRNDCQYIAFYRPEPVGAITHYAKVGEINTNCGDVLSKIERIMMFPEYSEEPASVFRLDDITKLSSPIQHTGQGIQGSMYKKLDQILSANFVEDLMETKHS